MSIAERVQDAALLRSSGRHEGALMNVLLAVAAASAAAYPKSEKNDWKTEWQGTGFDAWRFKKYLAPRLIHLLTGSPDTVRGSAFRIEFKGQPLDIEEILYEHYRCNLVHQGFLPSDVVWKKPQEGDSSTAVEIGSGDTLTLGGAWFDLLACAALDRMPATPPAIPYRANKPKDRDVWNRWHDQEVLNGLVPSVIDDLRLVLGSVEIDNPTDATPQNLQDSLNRLLAAGRISGPAFVWLGHTDCVNPDGLLTPTGLSTIEAMKDLLEFSPA